jgi:hypothetical protein
MTNINCSANCEHVENGKCKLNHVNLTASIIGYGSDCAYFSPRVNGNSAPPEKK